MIWIFTFKKRIDLNVQDEGISILYILNTVKNILEGKMAQKYFTVLKSEYFPKFSFEIKLDGTHYEFSVAVRLGHIIFLY